MWSLSPDAHTPGASTVVITSSARSAGESEKFCSLARRQCKTPFRAQELRRPHHSLPALQVCCCRPCLPALAITWFILDAKMNKSSAAFIAGSRAAYPTHTERLSRFSLWRNEADRWRRGGSSPPLKCKSSLEQRQARRAALFSSPERSVTHQLNAVALSYLDRLRRSARDRGRCDGEVG